MPDGLRITTLGGLTITLDGVPTARLPRRKAEALLVYLACTRRPHARDVLADLLWDDLAAAQAHANLSVLLSGLRAQLGGYLVISRSAIAFNQAAPHWVDTIELET